MARSAAIGGTSVHQSACPIAAIDRRLRSTRSDMELDSRLPHGLGYGITKLIPGCDGANRAVLVTDTDLQFTECGTLLIADLRPPMRS